MKTINGFVIAALLFAPGVAVATTCGGQNVIGNGGSAAAAQTAIQTKLNGKVVCVGTAPNWQAQEWHNSGSLTDYKKGPSDARDPSTVVGSYTFGSGGTSNANRYGTVTYTYGTATSGPYMIGTTGTTSGNIFFCTPSTSNQSALVSGTYKTSAAAAACP
jgi:hypothetical protein